MLISQRPKTPAELLAELKTVDGASSGLDADTLDGNSSSAFAEAGHDHDAEYSALGHNHDSRYYTQAQVDSMISSSNATLTEVWTGSGDSVSVALPDGVYVVSMSPGKPVVMPVTNGSGGVLTVSTGATGTKLEYTSGTLTVTDEEVDITKIERFQ